MDKSFGIIQAYYQAVWTDLDFKKFSSLFSATVALNYTYNGATESNMSLDEFLRRMEKGHFKNTTSVEVRTLNITRAVNSQLFLVNEEAILERLGYGRDEDGPGTYHYHGSGGIIVKDGLITYLSYTFTKKKV